MKRNVPGPYTFILRANSKVPKIVQSRRKTIGFRIPENPIALQIISGLNDYLASTSLKVETDQGPEVYYSDPEEIEERFGKLVDVIIDGGIQETHLSSVIDCTASVPEIIREGVAPVI
jgi:tRNA threonylcarbamoyl adenosine modification protein (Sua5/YciO/YrdC/YwlC family)